MPIELSPGELVKIGTAHTIGGAEQAVSFNAKSSLALIDIFAEQVMKFVRAHRALKLGPLDHLPHKGVGIQQHVVIEQHVVNANDAVVAQLDVIEKRRAGEKLHAEAVVQVVIKVRARGNDPVHEARFISGIRQDLPSPAGVSAPVSDMPTVPSPASILLVKSRHASARRPPL